MRLTRTRRYVLIKNAARRLLPFLVSKPRPVDDGATCAAILECRSPVMDWPAGIPKPKVGLVRDLDPYPYWTRYQSWLVANDMPYDYYDIHCSDWLEQARDYDMILWRPMSFPHELEECRRKYWVLEREMGKLCAPSYAETLLYEDKALQYFLMRVHDLPAVDTFVSHSEKEVRQELRRRDYPTVWKITCGSGSFGVELARRRAIADRWARAVFSYGGRPTYWPYVGQKDYVLLQRLEPTAGWDLRVIVAGDALLGYYRDVPSGEFRASGMHTERYGELPQSALHIAAEVARKLDTCMIAVDMIADPLESEYRIIELSAFPQVDEVGLKIDGQTGVYRLRDGGYVFEAVKVMPQDLALECVMRRRWIPSRRAAGVARAKRASTEVGDGMWDRESEAR